MGAFPVRQAIERLRAGLFDPVAVDRLTMEEEGLVQTFVRGLKALEKGQAGHLCICGSYGQGKSHNLTYLQRQARDQGYATSFLQLDVRETPFHQFPVVYQSIMKNLSLPTGESFAARWKEGLLEVADDMPHRFRMILQALRSKNKLLLKKGGVKSGLKPKDFDYWLGEALAGHDLPISCLTQILKARGVEGYREQPLAVRGNDPYVQMIQSLGTLLHAMGLKGLVLFFDEAESIAQGRLSARVKSYGILSQFFQQSGFVYPVFAFTETFFDQVRSEEYGGEIPRFPQNYSETWKSVQIVRLQDSSLARWETLQDRLITLYAEAYQIDITAKALEIKQQMRVLLGKLNSQETRFKLKALVHQLDIFCTGTAS
ncbi:MAG: BREX system ATP-binding domain-containing protein [Chlamydiales bacterium]